MTSVNLLAIAAEPSSEKRRVLLRQITDLFFDGSRERNVSETALFEEVVLRVVRDVGTEARAEFATRVAGEETLPRGLALSLACDPDVAVALPILSTSLVLEDQDLAMIANDANDEMLGAIAVRPSISEIVTDVLVRRGSSLVVRSVSANHGARFSQYGFGELVRRAESDEALQMNLAQRPDLPEAVVTELVSLLSDKLKQTLSALGEDHLSPAMMAELGKKLVGAFREKENEARELDGLIADIRNGKMNLGSAILPIAKADRAFDVATLLSEFAGVDHPTAMKALTGTNDEPLIVLFRSLDIAWETFETILQMRAKRQRKVYAKSQSIQRTYNQMDQPTAQRVLRFLQVRRNSDPKAA